MVMKVVMKAVVKVVVCGDEGLRIASDCGFCLLTVEQTDIGDCRVSFMTENVGMAMVIVAILDLTNVHDSYKQIKDQDTFLTI